MSNLITPKVFAHIDMRTYPELYLGFKATPERVNKNLLKNKNLSEEVNWIFYASEVHNIYNEVFGPIIPRNLSKKEFKKKVSEYRNYIYLNSFEQ